MVKRVNVSEVGVPCMNHQEHCVLQNSAVYLSGWYSKSIQICHDGIPHRNQIIDIKAKTTK